MQIQLGRFTAHLDLGFALFLLGLYLGIDLYTVYVYVTQLARARLQSPLLKRRTERADREHRPRPETQSENLAIGARSFAAPWKSGLMEVVTRRQSMSCCR